MLSTSASQGRETSTLAAVERFNDAFNRQDIYSLSELITDDCVFDTTEPAPDGTRFDGRNAVLDAWREFFHASPGATFATEEMFACGDRCIVRWRYTWDPGDPGGGHVRGVDIFRVSGDLIAEKLSYVKG